MTTRKKPEAPAGTPENVKPDTSERAKQLTMGQTPKTEEKTDGGE